MRVVAPLVSLLSGGRSPGRCPASSRARRPRPLGLVLGTIGLLGAAGCASSGGMASGGTAAPARSASPAAPAGHAMTVSAATAAQTASLSAASRQNAPVSVRMNDPRVGLKAGLLDAGTAIEGLRLVSATPTPEAFVGHTNSDLAFTGHYAIQGNYNGFQVWDISNPAAPVLVKGYVCPASQSDVSVYKNLLFVSGEGLEGRLDCGTEGVKEAASPERLRGIRIFDISDVRNPKYVGNVQTCRGSHTHSVLVDPEDPDNVYVYVSGQAGVRPAEELPGCSGLSPDEDPNTALFRIEVIKVPLAHPEQAAIVSSPRIFENLVAPPEHGLSDADVREIEAAKERGAFIVQFGKQEIALPDQAADNLLAQEVKARGGTGAPTAADSASLRAKLPEMVKRWSGGGQDEDKDGPKPGPTQCHDITLYPEIGLAGGACAGYGLLLDISDPVHPVRLAAVADSNFSYWHSATFNNDGTKVLFSDEWGGGGQPKCRAGDPMEWGADAIFTIENGALQFQGYYKMPAPQTSEENCVAHNGSLIPVPGRDVMVQAWYQGGISVFDWTDPGHPVEIAYFDRGPIDAEKMEMGGSWSAYWYDGRIYSSEIARGLDVLALAPTPYLTENEIAAAESAKLDYFNVQGQRKYTWPASFALARAYVDQLERSGGMSAGQADHVREHLAELESAPDAERREGLAEMATHLAQFAGESSDGAKVTLLAETAKKLSAM